MIVSEKSRTFKTLRNAMASMFNKILVYGLRFASRTVFVYSLSKYYLGVSALFSSIITLLSLADLGFAIALPQSLYQPLYEKNENKICSIIKFYSRVYNVICLTVLLLGLAFLPFLGKIVGEMSNNIPEIQWIYILFVLQSAFSYLFVYKRTLLIADQKNYIVIFWDSFFEIVTAVLQIAILLFTKNYLLYLLISVATTLLCNCWNSRVCDKTYPFLKRCASAAPLEKNEIRDLIKKIYALILYRIATVVETGTDNIIITSIFGLVLTGLCSNYILVLSSITGVMMAVMSAATPSIGNLIVSSKESHTYDVYKMLDFISFWIYGACGLCYFILIDSFVGLWLGKDFLIEFGAVVFMSLNFYVSGLQNVNSNFRNAYGFFYECRYRPLLMVVVNIVSSVILGYFIGIMGIFAGTLLSRLLTVGIMDPFIVFSKGLHKPLVEYYKSHLLYHLIVIAVGFLLYFLFNGWYVNSFVQWLVKGCVVFLSVNLIFGLLFYKTSPFQSAKKRIMGLVHHVS